MLGIGVPAHRPRNRRAPHYRFLRPARDLESTAWAPPPATGAGEAVAELRDQAGRQRDVAARYRDQAGEQRDHAADHRDRRAELRHHRIDRADPDPAHTWAAAASDREHSRMGRQVGATDRVEARHDRSSAAADRSAAAGDRQHAATDALPAVHTRQAGSLELDRDLARVAHTDQRLVLAFVDVDHLKSINDACGHAGGDRVLRQVADTLQKILRPYDLVIRYGGDEFLCALTGVDLDAAADRLARVNTLLEDQDGRPSVTIGLAQWQQAESAGSLIDRADAARYRQSQLDRP